MMDDDDDKLSTKSVKLPVFSGDHKHFQTWWFRFSAFATVWKFKQAVGQTEDPDLPASEGAALNTDANTAEKQKMAKKRNAIAFANLTTALDSPSLIGILMRAQTTEWPSGLACNVIKQLFEKYEPKDTVSLIDMNRLKQKIGLTNAQGNPQEMFEQMAAIENQFKTEIPEAKKVAMAIEKLPAEYRSVLTAEMRKEGVGITSSHIESAAFQHWRAMYGSFASNPVIDDGANTADNNKEVALAAFSGTCNRCGKRDTRRRNAAPNSTSMDKHWESNRAPTIRSNKMSKKEMERAKVQPNSKEPATTVLNMGTKRLIVERRKPMKRKEIANKKRELQLFLTKVLSFYCMLEWNMG